MSSQIGSLISRTVSENSIFKKPNSQSRKNHSGTSNAGSIRQRHTIGKSKSVISLSHGRRVPFSYPFKTKHAIISKGEQTHIDSITHKIHPWSVIFSILFILYYRKLNIQSMFIAFLLFLCLRESLQTVRLARTDRKIYQFRILLQIIGDLLVIPYYIVFKRSETPLLQYQNTKINSFLTKHIKSIHKFSQTPWAIHSYFQFILLVIEEQYRSKEELNIMRELVYTKDGGMVALDWWLPFDIDNNDKSNWKYCESKCKKYKSKMYYQFNENIYDKYFDISHNSRYEGDITPILFVFSTYCGDSMGAPQKKLCKYFISKNWKVVVYCKRGCGSPYVEMLPLTNCKLFDLQGLSDSQLVVDIVSKRYPNAPLFCAGFSVGGNMVHDFLALLNNKKDFDSKSGNMTKNGHNNNGNISKFGRSNKYFDGGVKIDGMSCWYSDLLKFNERQGLLSQILAQLPFLQLQQYVKENPKEAIDSGYNLDAFLLGDRKNKNIKDSEKKENVAKSLNDVDMKYVVKHLFAVGSDSSHNSNEWQQYAQLCGPCDIELVDSPMLALNSWNDSFQSPEDNPIGIANVNPNIIHCITRGGTHCIRRQGMFFYDCWISKVTYEYCMAVLNYKTKSTTSQQC